MLSDEDLTLTLRDVSTSFPELQDWKLEASFGYAGGRYAYVRVVKSPSIKYAKVKVNRRCKGLSIEAVSALLAHELAHIVLQEHGIDNSDEAASREALKRGFGGFSGSCLPTFAKDLIARCVS